MHACMGYYKFAFIKLQIDGRYLFASIKVDPLRCRREKKSLVCNRDFNYSATITEQTKLHRHRLSSLFSN